ncbi:DUF4191 family protein [Nakamurella sp. YIM 132087]|uniref:DUF4191 family protein n=1 Tax=Nakamurella alba TaxID=2665158 RepID=A0A7K1FHD5_9ACTN|nr:DUF4191 domain-containing protein [Nakamurella alba]MTD13535.1 DUF4191 family protein [Nakamurella alba]
MAKSKSGGAAVSKEEKKAAKVASKAARKERWSQIWQAFQMQRKEDKKLLPILIGTFLIVAAIGTGIGLLTFTWWIGLIFGVIMGVLVAMIVFARRVQSNVYKQADGTPGAAAWSLQNNLRGRWRITPAVAGTTQLDAVHRVIGRPGVILIGEGAPHRVKPLLAQEKKRIARVVGEKTPIYDIIVGHDEGQTPLKKLNPSLMRLPRNISPSEVSELDTRLASLAKTSLAAGMPKGPMPAGAKMRNMQRATRKAR